MVGLRQHARADLANGRDVIQRAVHRPQRDQSTSHPRTTSAPTIAGAMAIGAGTQQRGRGGAHLAVAAMQQAQRVHGNQTVQRMVERERARSAEAPVQRYTVVDPANYGVQPETRRTKPFTSQRVQYHNKTDTDPDTDRPHSTYTLKSVTRHHKNPPLRVADTGDMAIEHAKTQGSEQKVFYARPELILASKERLEDIGSSVTLDLQSSTITVPATPKHPNPGETTTLSMVVPRRVGTAQGTAFRGRTSICNKFADDIMGKTGDRVSKEDALAIFQPDGSDKSTTQKMNYKYRSDVNEVSPFQVAGAIGAGVTSPKKLAKTFKTDRSIDADARKEIADLIAEHDVRMLDLAQDAYATTSTPQAARDEIKLRVKQMKGKDKRLTATSVDHIISKYTEVPPITAYANLDKDALRDANAGLGTNEYASPEVGEAFGGMSVGTGGIAKVNKQDEVVGAVDYRGLTKKQSRKLDTQLDPKKASKVDLVSEIMPLAKELHDHVKTGIWTWHFASVVAKSGSDVVTLENYNRAQGDKVEADAQNEKLWRRLEEDYHELIKHDKELRKQIKAAPDAAAKLQLLSDAAANAVGRDLKTFVMAAKKAMPDEVTRWFFQMYGPANKAQSFHDEWATDPEGDFINPLTLRWGEPASEPYKQEMIDKLHAEVTKLSNSANDNPLGMGGDIEYLSRLKDEYKRARKRINKARTKVEVSKAYRAGLGALNDVDASS